MLAAVVSTDEACIAELCVYVYELCVCVCRTVGILLVLPCCLCVYVCVFMCVYVCVCVLPFIGLEHVFHDNVLL